MTPKLTDWLPISVKPSRKGVYEVQVVHTRLVGMYSYFDGKKFKYIMRTPDKALNWSHDDTGAVVTKWRGLASDPAVSK